jgi:hypothetical protein
MQMWPVIRTSPGQPTNACATSYVQVTTAVVVVCLDLSEPSAVLPAAELWLKAVRDKLAATFEVRSDLGGWRVGPLARMNLQAPAHRPRVASYDHPRRLSARASSFRSS